MQKDKQVFTSRSPLRYPGGKTRGISFITQYFPTNITEMISPFFGGGSIELHMAAKGITVLGFDVFQPLIEFWQCLQDEPEWLAKEIEKWHPIIKRKFLSFTKNPKLNFLKRLNAPLCIMY